METFRNTKDPFTRRAFVNGAAGALLGVGAIPRLSNMAAATIANGTPVNIAAKTKSVIYLYMDGGMSHLDTFDTKPGAKTQGPVESIKTNSDGVLISEFFPKLADQMHNIAVINSMNSNQGAHEQGRYFMRTSYFLQPGISHPEIGAWSAKHLGKINENLPANVAIGGQGTGNGFLDSKFGSLLIGNPEDGLKNSELSQDVGNTRFNRRLRKLKKMNMEFSKKFSKKELLDSASMYDEAVKLMRSQDLQAFDLKKELDEVRDRYGRSPFGQACLLARRLVQHGVRFVEVDYGNWDTHRDNFGSTKKLGAVLDQALASLLADLEAQGMLDSTLVVLATEFGRTPTIFPERDNGRNHFPQAFTCLLAGGGIKGGLKYGKTDNEGREVIKDMVTVPDFNATISHALGIPLDVKTLLSTNKEFTVADNGKPILGLFR